MSPANTVTKDQSAILKIIEAEKEISQLDLAKKAKFDQVKVARIVLELSEIGFIDSIEKTEREFSLTKEGKKYLKEGLPEKQVFLALKEIEGKILLDDFKEKSKLNPMIVNIAMGWLRKKNWVEFSKEGKKTFVEAKEISDDIDEQVLELIGKNKIQEELTNNEIQKSIDDLKKRKLIEIQEKRVRITKLSTEGEKYIKQGIKILDKMETTLTPKMIITGSWKKKQFKPYDPTESVPVTYFGRKHPVIEVINELREIFIEMGYTEIRGPIVESEFWNFDALFQPQDHPARELADTFKISKPNKADLPSKEIKQTSPSEPLYLIKRMHR